MADEKNTAVPQSGDHDRVAMLSLAKDGTPDQNRPEIVGDKAFALAAAQRQFAEQAVSAVDSARRAASRPGETVKQDPTIAEAKAEHEKAEKSAEASAKKVVDALYEG